MKRRSATARPRGTLTGTFRGSWNRRRPRQCALEDLINGAGDSALRIDFVEFCPTGFSERTQWVNSGYPVLRSQYDRSMVALQCAPDFHRQRGISTCMRHLRLLDTRWP